MRMMGIAMFENEHTMFSADTLFADEMDNALNEMKNLPPQLVKWTKVRQVLLEEFGEEEAEAIDALMEKMK